MSATIVCMTIAKKIFREVYNMAEDFKNGVQWFTKGVATIPVYFPEDKIKCQNCQFCRSESDLKRFWCRLTGQMIYNPFCAELPENCPIEFTGEIVGLRKEGG